MAKHSELRRGAQALNLLLRRAGADIGSWPSSSADLRLEDFVVPAASLRDAKAGTCVDAQANLATLVASDAPSSSPEEAQEDESDNTCATGGGALSLLALLGGHGVGDGIGGDGSELVGPRSIAEIKS